MRPIRRFFSFCVLFGVLGGQAFGQTDPLTWPEPQRAFFQDGPALLLTPEQRAEFQALDEQGREQRIRELLDRDPIPETPANELRAGIERRQRLATVDYASPLDVRAQILFLNGPPAEKKVLDCGFVFEPLEIWTYHQGKGQDGKPVEKKLVVYKPSRSEPWKLWLPSDSKKALYTDTMEYWLEQWEELRHQFYIKRIDIQNCKEAVEVDEVTGIRGITGAVENARVTARLRAKDASAFLEVPKDLAAWARAAAATEVPEAAPSLEITSLDFRFPDLAQQRMTVRTYIAVPPDGLKPHEGESAESKKPEVVIAIDGMLESEGRPFEEFRVRYRLTKPQPGAPVSLVTEQQLRPGESFVMRLRVKDEGSGSEARIARAFRVPMRPTGDDLEAKVANAGALVPEDVGQGHDSLLLLPPPADVVLGLWRADALVTGKRIQKVVFKVDGVQQLIKTNPPFSAELRLNRFPTEQVVRAEGYDAEGKLVAADEVILNQPRGALAVWITEPAKGARVPPGRLPVKAEVSVPDGRRIVSVEFKINDQTVATLTKSPWQSDVKVPNEEMAYVTVAATLDDGSRSESVRFVRAPQYFEEVEVNLVELYVAVTDRSGDLVKGLTVDDFEVLESGKKQEISKFELVENLPLTVGILLDTSGSMRSSLVQAQEAAGSFLRGVMTPRDRSFAVSFASKPRLNMPPTDDVEAVVRGFEDLQAVGDTALHDALVHSLYYFRGIKGQRALVLLSDGDDNASYIAYNDALEYARRSGVAVYAIGFNLPGLATGLRSKLSELSETSGGKAFFTSKAEELPAIYEQIERELRSRYLVAYNSNQASGKPGAFREVEVKVKRGLKARTARGYYQ
ncbi:MAG TPA: VWA domain-containing protein [Thermoanaerobaculia bacterium]|nr:VWA domain-containing protein [Thermoanaerobaculia bacterium]